MAWFVCWFERTRSGHCGSVCRVVDSVEELRELIEARRNVVVGYDLYELSRAAVELCRASAR